MREIPVSQGNVAFVDDEDYERIARFRWTVRPSGGVKYALRGFNSGGRKHTIGMHRMILNAAPGQIVDHVDRNGLNNVRANLRFASVSDNSRNSMHRLGKSGFRGVVEKQPGIFQARLHVRDRCLYFGNFRDPIEAALARDAAARLHHGRFAILNFPTPDEVAASRTLYAEGRLEQPRLQSGPESGEHNVR